MKVLLLLAATALSFNSYALSKSSDWSEIRQNRRINIVQPKFAEAFGKTGLFNACVTYDEIRSISPVGICLNYEEVVIGSSDSDNKITDQRCTKTASQDIVLSRSYNEMVCTKRSNADEISSSECVRWENKTQFYPDTYRLEIVRADKLEAGNHLFYKTLVLPVCD